MFCILTDGSEVYSSIFVLDEELVILNKDADKKTDGNIWWEEATKENCDLPKSSIYTHVNGGLGGIYVS